jgi:hypothetical protein
MPIPPIRMMLPVSIRDKKPLPIIKLASPVPRALSARRATVNLANFRIF